MWVEMTDGFNPAVERWVGPTLPPAARSLTLQRLLTRGSAACKTTGTIDQLFFTRVFLFPVFSFISSQRKLQNFSLHEIRRDFSLFVTQQGDFQSRRETDKNNTIKDQ